jgi:hypothetical protein
MMIRIFSELEEELKENMQKQLHKYQGRGREQGIEGRNDPNNVCTCE